MKITTTLKLPTYSCELVITVTDDLIGEANRIYKKYKIKEEFEGECEGAVVMPDIAKYYLLLNTKYLSHNTIAHEVFHAAVRVTEDRDIVDEEAQAWLAGHLTGVIYKFLAKKNIVITHGR
jgi:hypothetical protein